MREDQKQPTSDRSLNIKEGKGGTIYLYVNVRDIPGWYEGKLIDDLSGWHVVKGNIEDNYEEPIPCFWDGRNEKLTIYTDNGYIYYRIIGEDGPEKGWTKLEVIKWVDLE